MKNIKDFQARYDRWKNGERYWDIRGVDLPRYDTGDKNTNQEYIFQRPDGTYYSSPTNNNAFTEDVTPVLKRDLSNPATWDFVGSDTNKKYTTQYTDDQLRQMAQDSMPNAEMIPWVDRAGNKQRSARVIGLSPADPVTSLAVEYAIGLPGWKALDYASNKLAIDFARDFAFTKLGNWTRNKILSNQLNKNIENAALSMSYPYTSKVLNIMPKLSNGRYQFDSPTYQMYTGPKHDISEIINADGSVNLRNLLNIQNEALRNIPGGTIARHRLENQKWHPTDWNTFLHTRDAYKRALNNNYPQEALFPTLMHDFGKMWSGDGHGPYGASIVQQIFPKASKEQIQAIYGHMDANPVAPLTRLVKGVDIKEPNEFRYLQTPLNHHLQGEDAVKMFKEYGGTPIPEGSINGDQLRKYVMEARERYGLMGNTNISDEEIAQALYKHVNELGKGSAAINSQGEPQLLFRGDTKAYTQLKSHKLDGSHLDMDNEIGTLFTGEFPGTYGDQFDAVGSSRYLDGWSFNPTTNEWNWRAGGTGSNANKQEGYQMFFHIDPRSKLTDQGWVTGFKKASSTPEHPNDLNAFIVRTPAVRDASREISVMNEPYLIQLPSLKTKRFKYDTSKGRIVDTHNKIDDVLKNKHYVGMKYAIKEHYTNVLKDAQKNNQGLLKSSRIGENGVTVDNTLRDEHPLYSYFVLPDFNKQNAKHILPYDLRIPRNWSDPNIFRIVAPIGMGLPLLNNFQK